MVQQKQLGVLFLSPACYSKSCQSATADADASGMAAFTRLAGSVRAPEGCKWRRSALRFQFRFLRRRTCSVIHVGRGQSLRMHDNDLPYLHGRAREQEGRR